MSEEKSLVIVEQKMVTFYGDEVMAVIVMADGRHQIYVPLRPICDALGVAWTGQHDRTRRDPVLNELLMSIRVTRTDIEPGNRRPKTSEVICLPLDYLNGWLFGITANRVKPEIRERLIRYQRECYRVLAEAFQDGRLSADSDFAELLHRASEDAVEAYQMALAMVKLARNQIVLEARLDEHGHTLESYGRRLETIEATLSNPERYISREQASRISQAVRAIGLVTSERNGRNEYGAVYGELYRNFEISAYRELPSQKYEEAMKWLNAWYQRLTNQDIPF